jgi:hypothetical protein
MKLEQFMCLFSKYLPFFFFFFFFLVIYIWLFAETFMVAGDKSMSIKSKILVPILYSLVAPSIIINNYFFLFFLFYAKP